jgi:hypothetical protein
MPSNKERRQLLFKRSRPKFRPYEPSDNAFLWAAYKAGSLPIPEGLTQEQFIVEVAKMYGGFPLVWVVEDDNRKFKAGRGQVAMVGIKTDGWVYEPHPVFFKWATKRNVLRCCVAFFHMMRYQKDVGVCLVRCLKDAVKMMKKMERYGVLYLRGRLPKGSPKGDVFLFSIDGAKT